MGQVTKLANLINPEVLADYIDKKLIHNIVFAPLATVDNTLVGNPGDTIKFPAYAYIGSADDLTEGAAISTVSLNASAVSVKKFIGANSITLHPLPPPKTPRKSTAAQ